MVGTKEGKLLIGGSWIHGEGCPLVCAPPWAEEPVWEGRSASVLQVEAAMASTSQAARLWSKRPLAERIDTLARFVKFLQDDSNGDELAHAIALSSGKPLWEARTEVTGIVRKLDPSVDSLKSRAHEFRPSQAGGNVCTFFQPHGTIAVLGPFNFPVHMANVHIMPALLAGNCVSFKPSELVPLPAELYAAHLTDAGLPAGALNLLQGGGEVGEAMVSSPSCRGVCFTGSVPVGKRIENLALQRRVMAAVEMGGNSPLVVWDTTEVDAAVLIGIQSCFVTAGQRCSSSRRLIVPDNTFGRKYVERFVNAATQIRIGLPLDKPAPFYGPLVSTVAADTALEFQDRLISLGGIALARASRSDRCSSLVSPGIIDMSPVDAATIPDEEVMGPIVQVRYCEKFEDALALCNASSFGLAAGLVSESEEQYEVFRDRVEAGVLAWNVPLTGSSGWAAFGGMKDSGNFRPTGYFSADYTTRMIGASGRAAPKLPDDLPPGIRL